MPILDANALEIFSNSAEQSQRLGIQMGSMLQVGDVICLQGDLGTGKTTLVRGIAAGWGSPDVVTSPTFVLVNVYQRGDEERLAHMDAYRLEDSQEAVALDMDALIERGPLVVEWAERIESALPAERLWAKFHWVEEGRRRIEITPLGGRYEEMLEDYQGAVFGLA